MNYLDCNKKICRNEYYGLKINFVSETEEFVFSCLGNNGNITYCLFNSSLKFKEINKFDECESIYGYSTIYSSNLSTYYIISDEICNEKYYSYN